MFVQRNSPFAGLPAHTTTRDDQVAFLCAITLREILSNMV